MTPATFAQAFDQAHAAYLDGLERGDGDAYTGLPPESLAGTCPDWAAGYADGYSQETARQQGGRR